MNVPEFAASKTAYGLRFNGIRSPHLALATEVGAAAISVEQTTEEPGHPDWHGFGSHTGSVSTLGGVLRLDRDGRQAILHRPRPVADEMLVHPVLGIVASVFNWWLGRETLHAGAVSVEGRALGVLAPTHGGKTTLLGACLAQGHRVLSDDVLVVHEGRAMAGPRCLDLRPSAAAHLGQDGLRVRRRVRVPTGADATPVPIAGLVSLAWGRRRVTLLPPAERYRRIVAQSLTDYPGDVSLHLALARLPMWELRRPRSWSDLGWSVDRLAELAVGVEPGLLEEQLAVGAGPILPPLGA